MRRLVSCVVVLSAVAAWGQTKPSGGGDPNDAYGNAMRHLARVFPSESILRDKTAGEAAAPTVVPAVRGSWDAIQVIVDANPPQGPERALAGKAGRYLRNQPVLMAFGDERAAKENATQLKADDGVDRQLAKAAEILVKLLVGPGEEEQLAAVGEMEGFVKETGPGPVGDMALMYALQKPAVSAAVSSRLVKLAETERPGLQSMGYAAKVKARDGLKGFERQPFVFAGKTVEGKPFTTADWKGKVILVDFWATWCGPCVAEHPRLKGMYEKYHEQGFEIVRISNDYGAEALKAFGEKHPDMVWPTLFDAAAAEKKGWHPLTRQFGISGIPQMFLIDKKGVLRTVNARTNMEELVPKLLAE